MYIQEKGAIRNILSAGRACKSLSEENQFWYRVSWEMKLKKSVFLGYAPLNADIRISEESMFMHLDVARTMRPIFSQRQMEQK